MFLILLLGNTVLLTFHCEKTSAQALHVHVQSTVSVWPKNPDISISENLVFKKVFNRTELRRVKSVAATVSYSSNDVSLTAVDL